MEDQEDIAHAPSNAMIKPIVPGDGAGAKARKVLRRVRVKRLYIATDHAPHFVLRECSITLGESR